MNLKYIVTGTGRCGTLYMANFLRSVGINCGHESIFSPAGLNKAMKIINGFEKPINSHISNGKLLEIEGDQVAESSYMSAPFLNQFDAKVIHVVRNPFGVVNSFIDNFNYFSSGDPDQIFNSHVGVSKYHFFIYSHIKDLRMKMTQFDRACLFYIRWNQMIEESGKVTFFHRIEDDIENLKYKICKNEKLNCYKEKCNSLKKIKNKKGIEQIKTQSIKKEMIETINKYNYQKKLFC